MISLWGSELNDARLGSRCYVSVPGEVQGNVDIYMATDDGRSRLWRHQRSETEVQKELVGHAQAAVIGRLETWRFCQWLTATTVTSAYRVLDAGLSL